MPVFTKEQRDRSARVFEALSDRDLPESTMAALSLALGYKGEYGLSEAVSKGGALPANKLHALERYLEHAEWPSGLAQNGVVQNPDLAKQVGALMEKLTADVSEAEAVYRDAIVALGEVMPLEFAPRLKRVLALLTAERD